MGYYFKKMPKQDIKMLFKGKTMEKSAKEIGVSRTYLTRVINRWNSCSKFFAYTLTKYLDSEKEIEDFFDIKK